jgi:protein phosphatase
MASFDVFGITNKGLVRSNNEDSFVISPDKCLFAVCDGIGGYFGGEIASRTTSRTLKRCWKQPPKKASDICFWVEKSLRTAQIEMSKVKQYRNMGTTVLIAICSRTTGQNEFVHFAHLGDSRAYHLRSGKFRLITADHADNDGLLERYLGKNKSAAKALAEGKPLGVEHKKVHCLSGDTFLLCSDGLHGYVKRRAIKKVLMDTSLKSAEQVCRQLIKLAHEHGAPDNVTAIVMRVS